MKKNLIFIVLLFSLITTSFASDSIYNIFDHQYPLKTQKVELGIVGDVFLHAPQIKLAYNKNNQEFDFSQLFTYLETDISALDYAMFQLETTFSGYGNGDILGYSSFPYFNSPDSLAKNIKDTGFDFANTASNHSYDFSSLGLDRTIEILDENGFDHTGTFKDSHQPYFEKTINGITFAFIDYSYGSNGNLVKDEDKDKFNNFYDYSDYSQLFNDIEEAKSQNFDFIIVSIHAGVEYTSQASEGQKELFNDCLKAGADIIFGSHPHVLQPIEIVDTIDKQKLDRNKFIIYSLGNFLCNQIDLSLFNGANTDFGTLLSLNFSKQANEQAIIEAFKITPTYLMRQDFGNVVVPVYQDLSEMANYNFSDYNKS